jgi:hypothetical protein
VASTTLLKGATSETRMKIEDHHRQQRRVELRPWSELVPKAARINQDNRHVLNARAMQPFQYDNGMCEVHLFLAKFPLVPEDDLGN